MTYWASSGKHESIANQLRALIPESGAVVNPRINSKLEKYRKAVNCYYDLYNNGLMNRTAEFTKVFGFSSSSYKQPWRGSGRFDDSLYIRVESMLDAIIADAGREQGINE